MSNINPDLLEERQKATFDVERLTNVLDGGRSRTERRRQIQSEALNDKELCGGPDPSFLSRDEHFADATRRMVRFNQLRELLKLEDRREIAMLEMVAFHGDISVDNPHGLFVMAMENQCTEEQKRRWMAKVYSKEYLGTYAQTEMGHGSFLRGCETTATYDVSTDQFVLDTPTVSAMKWWPGGLGKTCNCAVVMAQVYTNGVCHGLYPFFVLLRDPDTHKTLPGITLGDIGPKMGFNSIDNGYLRLDRVAVPRDNMLMKHAEVLRDGTFRLKTDVKKPTYQTLTAGRIIVVQTIGFHHLPAAMTIAIRYSVVRRQSELRPGAREARILDFQTQQHKLLPHLAVAYGIWFVGQRLQALLDESLRDDADESRASELHAISSGLKAYATQAAGRGIEQARLACGGHGYSLASGLPQLYASAIAAVTFEGEGTVLELQTARYLMKCRRQAETGRRPSGSVAYLTADDARSSDLDRNLELTSLVAAFRHRSRRLIEETYESVQRLVAEGNQAYHANNMSGVRLVECARAHCEFFIVETFADVVSRQEDTGVAKVLTDLCRLCAVHWIVAKSGDFLEDGYVSRRQMQLLKDSELALLDAIRPNSVALVDAFDFPDRVLHSVLGRYDGQVYDNLYEWAKASPMNSTDVHWTHDKYVKHLIKAKI